MDSRTFKARYLAASHRFVREYGIVKDYLPVIDKAIKDTIEWFQRADVSVSDEDIGGAIVPGNKNQGKLLALYIKES
jgi:hypothetical protein